MKQGTHRHYTAKQAQEEARRILGYQFSNENIKNCIRVGYNDTLAIPYEILKDPNTYKFGDARLWGIEILARGGSWHEALENLQEKMGAGV